MTNFSSKYLNNYSILKTAYIGFEFEFYSNDKIPYYKLIEKLNIYFRDLGITVQGIRKYHPDTKPTENNFILTPDFSGGSNMCELITGKLEYSFARTILLKSLKFIQINGYTNDRCSIHINLSFNDKMSDKKIENINKLKMILNTDEDLIYKYFPNRKESFYAKSIKKIIPFKQFNYSNDGVKILQSNLELPDDDRYYGVNFIPLNTGRIEFRYLGGDGYDHKTSEILELLDYFIITAWNSIDETFTPEESKKLQKYLSDNINIYKNFNKLDNFIGNFPTISLEIDRQGQLYFVNVYYGDIYNELFDLISNTYNLSNCVINYDTANKKFEIVDANVKGIYDIENWSFIDCTINGGVFRNCEFVSCTINNTHLHDCKISDTDVFNCKLLNSNVDYLSKISMCFFTGGFMDGDMPDGVLRLAKVGENGTIGDDVKVVDESDDFFGIINKGEIQYQKDKLPDVGKKKLW